MAKLCAFSWPGNVRELRNIIERAVVTCSEPVIDADRLPSRVSGSEEPGNVVSIPIGSTFEEVERTVMLKTLASVHNNKSKAARILGLSRKTLHNKLRQYANSGA
jgi:DNA-binding NtrC family response regulator